MFNQFRVFVFLVSAALLCGLTSVCIEVVATELYDFRDDVILDSTDNKGLRYLIWISYTFVLMMSALLMTHFIAPTAGGSGVPQMKTFVSGFHNYQWLSFKTLCVKFIGLMLTTGCGMMVGRVGPFVHLGALIANNLSMLPFFNKLRENPLFFTQLIVIGCAIGVGSSLGVPIGGVMFSIEVTSAYSLTRNYWWANFATPIGGVTYLLFINYYLDRPLFASRTKISFPPDAYHVVELIAYAILGLICAQFVLLFALYSSQIAYRVKLITKKFRHFSLPWGYPTIIILVVASLNYPETIGDYVKLGGLAMSKDMFQNSLTRDLTLMNAEEWGNRDLFLNLFIVFLIWFVFVPLTFTLKAPIGLFLPTVATGALLGRYYGELMKALFDEINGKPIYPNGYAIAGAASFCAGFTGTFSAAIIVMELVGNFYLVFPIYVTTNICMLITRHLHPSIYEILAYNADLKMMPDLKLKNWVWNQTIAGLEKTNFPYISMDELSEEAVQKVLADNPNESLFVVGEGESKKYIGVISRDAIKKGLKKGRKLETLLEAPVRMSSNTAIAEAHMIFSTLNPPFLVTTDSASNIHGIVRREDFRVYVANTFKEKKLLLRWMI